MSGSITREPGEYHADPSDPGPGWNRISVSWAVADGRRVVVKSGTGRHRDTLRREAALLAALPPGLAVALVRLDEVDHATTLVSEEVPSRCEPGRAEDRIRRAAEACRSLAGLHRAGWAHGRFESGHVLFGPDGARLCSLGSAVSLDGDRSAARADLAALRSYLGDELNPGRAESRRERRLLVGAARSVDEHLGEPVLDDSPHTLDRLAGRLEHLGHGRRLRNPGAPDRRTRRGAAPHRRARRLGRRAAVSLAAVAVGTSIAVAAARTDSGGDLRTQESSKASAATTVGVHANSRCVPIGPTRPDMDGDRCGDDVEVDGRTIRIGRSRMEAGAPGDVVRLGDWDCDGRATVLVLRPSTGEVFEFREWAAPGAPVAVDAAAVVAGARTLPPQGSDACPDAVVRTGDGTDVVVSALRPNPGAPRP